MQRIMYSEAHHVSPPPRHTHTCNQVDFNLLHHIIYFATGARATLHGSVLRPCPIQELDLRHTLCKLSASDVVKLVIRHMPRLKALYACNMSHAHSYRELRYYSQDIQYAVVCRLFSQDAPHHCVSLPCPHAPPITHRCFWNNIKAIQCCIWMSS